MRRRTTGLAIGVALLLLLSAPAALGQGEEGGTPADTPEGEGGEADEGEAASADAPADAADEPAPPGTPSEAKTSKQAYNVKIKGLEEKVNQLKEKIFRSKARLMLLRETVLTGVISGATAKISHSNEMGAAYKLISAAYYLDGAPIFKKVDLEGSLDEKKEFEIYAGNVVPGPHLISVQLQYRGHGFGIFSYLEGYRFKVKSSYSFNAEEGKITDIKVVGYEKGGLTTDLKDRPSIRYDVKIKRESSVEAATEKKAGGEGEAAE